MKDQLTSEDIEQHVQDFLRRGGQITIVESEQVEASQFKAWEGIWGDN